MSGRAQVSSKVAVLKYRVGFRRTTVALVALCAVVLMSAHVGESDRTESSAIGTVRAILAGELTYASMNEGYYGTFECLASASCSGGVVGVGTFLDRELAATKQRRGYRFEFHAGPSAESGQDQRRSRSALTRFAVVATPMNAGTQRRAFCGDDTGVIYFTMGETMPRVEAGRCLDTRSSIDDFRPPRGSRGR